MSRLCLSDYPNAGQLTMKTEIDFFFFLYLDYIDYKTGKKRSTDPLITKTAISSGPNLKKKYCSQIVFGY